MPTTALGALSVPTTGTEVGTWGSASVNPNMVAIDGVQRGVQTISLAAATTFTLGAPSGSITPGTGPTAAQNAILKFSGTLSGNAVITLPLPGYYIIQNSCVTGSNYLQLRGVAAGQVLGVAPGGAWHVFNDGTNVYYANMGMTGSFLDLAVSTTPAWMAACSLPPYLLCDGSGWSISSFPVLGAMLGSTFGGNGITTFAVPDLRNRVRAPLGGGTGRISSGVSGLNGDAWGASGGSQSATIAQANLPNYNLAVSDPGHAHAQAFSASITPVTGATPVVTSPSGGSFGWATGTASTGISVALAGSGVALPTLTPTMISGMTFIKT